MIIFNTEKSIFSIFPRNNVNNDYFSKRNESYMLTDPKMELKCLSIIDKKCQHFDGF